MHQQGFQSALPMQFACRLPIALVLVALVAAGCSLLAGPQARQLLAPGSLDVDDLGVVALEGKSRVVGSVRIPKLGPVLKGFRLLTLETTPPRAGRVEALTSQLLPAGIEAEVDPDGQFLLDLVPRDTSLVLRVVSDRNGQVATMRKITRSETDLNCVKIDIASTMVADKILSAGREGLFKKEDPALQNAPLIELFKPEELNRLEEKIRGSLEFKTEEDVTFVEQILKSQGPSADPATGRLLVPDEVLPAARLFDAMVKSLPELAEDYHQRVFERPEAELRFNIKATGLVRNRTKSRLKLKGKYNLRFGQLKPGTEAIELWFSTPITAKLGRGDIGNQWTIALNTFAYPDGQYTMKTLLKPFGGNKRPLGSTEVAIDNSFTELCK